MLEIITVKMCLVFTMRRHYSKCFRNTPAHLISQQPCKVTWSLSSPCEPPKNWIAGWCRHQDPRRQKEISLSLSHRLPSPPGSRTIIPDSGAREVLNINKEKEVGVLQTLHSDNFRSLERPAQTVPNALKNVASANHKIGEPQDRKAPPGLSSWCWGESREKRDPPPWSHPLQTLLGRIMSQWEKPPSSLPPLRPVCVCLCGGKLASLPERGCPCLFLQPLQE